MNPSLCTTPEQLFTAAIHAGGWPKLGWCTEDADEPTLTCFDER